MMDFNHFCIFLSLICNNIFIKKNIMNKLIIVLIFAAINITGFSKSVNDTIKIADDLELIKMSDNVYIHVSYANIPNYGRVAANGLVYINNKQAFLLDTPWNDIQTEKLFSWITKSMGLKLIGFIPTHWHDDCIGGLGFLHKQKIESYANQMTIDIAKSKKLPTPLHGFTDSMKLSIGDKLIQCYYLGAAHSLDNIVIYFPSEQILFAGCMIKDTSWQNLGYTADGDVKAYPKTLDKLLLMFPTAKIVIPGHGQSGGVELIKHTKGLLTTIEN